MRSESSSADLLGGNGPSLPKAKKQKCFCRKEIDDAQQSEPTPTYATAQTPEGFFIQFRSPENRGSVRTYSSELQSSPKVQRTGLAQPKGSDGFALDVGLTE